MSETLSASIGALGTVSAAILSYLAHRHKAEAIRRLATSHDERVLAAAEITPAETLESPGCETPTSEQSFVKPPAPADVKIIFPGNTRFMSSSKTTSTGEDIDTDYSNISVVIDGEHLGSGDGYVGFSLGTTLRQGRHTLVATWTGEKTRYHKERGFRTLAELGGREMTHFWVVGETSCDIHLDGKFQVEYAHPSIVMAGCYSCGRVAPKRCRCTRPYCDKHAAELDGAQVCQWCRDRRISMLLTAAQLVSGLVALIGVVLYMKSCGK